MEPEFGRFKVINHIEIPKSEMHYDMAVQTVIELDKKYHPFAIYPDRGAGEILIDNVFSFRYRKVMKKRSVVYVSRMV